MLTRFAAALVAVCLLAAALPQLAVAAGACGTVLNPEQIALEQQRLDLGEPLLPPAGPASQPYVIPMTIHIVRTSSGTDGLSMADLSTAINQLNNRFAAAQMSFVICGSVMYIDDDNYNPLPNAVDKQNNLRQIANVPNTMNVYFTNMVGLAGQSTYSSYPYQGVIVDNLYAANGSTFPHEVGHFFDLYHTHEAYYGLECPDGSNGTTAGDLCADTPADPNLYGHVSGFPACLYDDYASPPPSCGPMRYHPSTANIMSYATKECRDEFTTDQINRAVATLVNQRPGLLNGCPSLACSAGDQTDVNDDGNILTAADLIFLVRYLTGDVSSLFNECSAQIDGFINPYFPCEPTFGDVVAYSRYFVHGIGAIGAPCGSDATPSVGAAAVVNLPGDSYFSSSGTTTGKVRLENTSNQNIAIWSVTVPLTYSFLGTPPSTFNLTATQLYTHGVWDTVTVQVNADSVVGFFYGQNGNSALVLGPYQSVDLMDIQISYTAATSAVAQPKVFMKSPGAVPVMSSAPTFPAAMEPLATNPTEAMWIPAPACCFDTRGNFDGSENDAVDSSDLGRLVAFLFTTDAGDDESYGPLCLEEGNTDGLGQIDSSDLGLLVAFLFSTPGSVILPECP